MKIIDFEKKGNVVRFYLGNDDCTDYWGDDWDDYPYECNAGRVSPKYIVGYKDLVFDFASAVLEPADTNSHIECSKKEMKNRVVPCIIVVPANDADNLWFGDDFYRWLGADGVEKYYFGDRMEITE